MGAVRTSIEIDAPPEKVWEYVMDPTHSGDWVTIHRNLKGHSGGALRKGYEMQQGLHLRGVNFDVHWTLTEVDAPHYAKWEGKGPVRSKALIVERLTSLDGGSRTHFDYENDFKAPFGALGAAASRALTGGVPRREADASLQKLKHILESDNN
jgi:uncharacterized protein YndB with AHSA1/START domain